MYILKRTDQGGGYVAPAGSRSSYTHNPLNARRYPTEAAAVADSCPGNETPVDLNKLADLHGPR